MKCVLAVGIGSARPLSAVSAVGISSFLREKNMGAPWRWDVPDIVPPGRGRHNPSHSSSDGKGDHPWRQRQGLERTVYEAGVGRKIFLSLAFLILLPFFASLPAMLISRLMHGLWFDTIGLIIFSALFTALMALLAVQLYQSLRSRVELGDTSVKLTLPQGSGATPMLRFVNTEIPYDQIDRSRRAACCSGALGARAAARHPHRHQGRPHVRLGNVNEDNVDQALPFPEIGAKLAERAGCRRRRRRHGAPIHRAARAGLHRPQDGARGQPAVTEAEMAEINGRHARAMRYLVIVMAVLVVGGIAIDVFTAPKTSFATVGASGPAGRSSGVSWRTR